MLTRIIKDEGVNQKRVKLFELRKDTNICFSFFLSFPGNTKARRLLADV